MGMKYPVYNREPIFKNNRNIFNYTFDQDQCGFREDLMSLQSRKMNQNDYGMYNLFKKQTITLMIFLSFYEIQNLDVFVNLFIIDTIEWNIIKNRNEKGRCIQK